MTATAVAPRAASPASAGSGTNTGSAERGTFVAALAIAAIRESKLNPRKHYDEAKLKELADSLRDKGQLTPVLVRPVLGATTEAYELAAGHRRRRAAELAGLTHLAAIVRPMDDDSFLEILTVENMQRDDLTPLEESEGYAALLKRPGYDVPMIAAKVSKSESYIYRRLALAKLIPSAKQALAKREIELGHAEILAPLPEALQKELLRHSRYDERYGNWSVRQLRSQVRDRHLLELKRAPWAMTDATLPGGACANCPKRTGAAPALFADVATDDSCLDMKCHAGKLKAFLQRRRAELQAEHGKDLLILDRDPYSFSHQVAPPAGALRNYDVESCSKDAKDAKPAMIWRSDKAEIGKLVYVRKPTARKRSGTEDRYQREMRQKYERARLRTKANTDAALAAAQAADVTALAKVPQLAILVAGALAQMSGDTNRILKSVDWVPKDCATRPSGVKALTAIASLGATDQARLLVLLTLLPYVQVHVYAMGDGSASALTRFCNEFGVKVDSYVRAAEKARQVEERAKKTKKAKGKKATKKPAKKGAKPAARKAPVADGWIDDGDEEF